MGPIRRAAVVILLALPTASVGLSQMPAHYIRIDIPRAVSSESVFIRYILAGEELGGWVQPRPGVSSYIIGTTREGQSASGIKAVLYAPGCAIQTLDIPLSNANNPQYSFICQPLGSVWIVGKLIQPERLSGREVQLHARYIARWAQSFLGLPAEIPLTIPLGEVASLSADNSFRISVPDLSRDPLAAAWDHLGELQIWAKDKSNGDDVAQLVPRGSPTFKTRMGGLKIQSDYPPETAFAPCALPRRPLVLVDREGFSVREFSDPCGP
jgi:hypothetical protein